MKFLTYEARGSVTVSLSALLLQSLGERDFTSDAIVAM